MIATHQLVRLFGRSCVTSVQGGGRGTGMPALSTPLHSTHHATLFWMQASSLMQCQGCLGPWKLERSHTLARKFKFGRYPSSDLSSVQRQVYMPPISYVRTLLWHVAQTGGWTACKCLWCPQAQPQAKQGRATADFCNPSRSRNITISLARFSLCQQHCGIAEPQPRATCAASARSVLAC